MNMKTEIDSIRSPMSGVQPATQTVATPRVVIDTEALRTSQRMIGLLTIVIPPAGTVLTIVRAFRQGVTWLEVVLLVVMFTLTNFGLEFGFHRNLAHRAFKTSKWMQGGFAVLGSMAGTGRLLFWVANHRRHHQCSDKEDDPHSPHIRHANGGAERLGLIRGLWHAHIGHILSDRLSNCTLLAKDVNRDPMLRTISQNYAPLVLLGLAIPTGIAWAWTGTLDGALGGLLWGGLTRMFLVYQATWSLASFSHRFGGRPFDNGDHSANNIWVALASFGSGWQNNHHAFPYSAQLGLKWWQIDQTAWLINACEAAGLVWDVRRATPAQISARLKDKGSTPAADAQVPEVR